MKTDIISLICGSFSMGFIEQNTADIYIEFVRCADLNDIDDIEILENIENILSSNMNYIMEKKSTTQYRREKFKKKYNYVPNKVGAFSDNYGGTITDPVTRKKFQVNIGNSNSITDEYGEKRLREMEVDSEDGIVVDNTYWKIPARRSNAILNHEIGHDVLHENDINGRKFRKSDERNENNKVLSKFAFGGHNNIEEFEADRYAANISGKKNLIRALRQATKIDSNRNNIKKEMHARNDIIRHNEYKIGIEDGDSVKSIEDAIKKNLRYATKANINKVRKNRIRNNDIKTRTRALNAQVPHPHIYK